MRGPLPKTAIDAALTVAQTRGFVTPCQQGRDSIYHFVIHADNSTAVVGIQRCRRLHGSVEEIEWQCHERISRLKLIPPGLCRSLELWACSPRGILRFFRIAGAGLIELKKNGERMNGDISGTPGGGI